MSDVGPEVLVVSRWLGKASEPWLYRQVTGLTRYRASVAVEGQLNRYWYPFARVTELVPANPWRRRWMRLGRSLRAGHWLNREQLKRMGLQSLISRQAVQLMHVHFLWNGYALDIASRVPVPVVFTAHGSDVMRAFGDPAYRSALQLVFDRAARIVAVSAFIAERLQALGCPADRITVLRLGVSLPEKWAVRHGTGQPLRLLSIGSLLPIKGHADLLQAFALALKERPELCLTIVGEGPLRMELDELVRQLGLEQSVSFTGALPQQQVAALLAESDIYVQMGARLEVAQAPDWPSEEGLGISYVEAAAYALPLIGTAAGGVSEICRAGESGLLVAPGDVAGMSASILRLADDARLRAKLGEGGRRLVEQEFDQMRQIVRLEALYDDVLASPVRIA